MAIPQPRSLALAPAPSPVPRDPGLGSHKPQPSPALRGCPKIPSSHLHPQSCRCGEEGQDDGPQGDSHRQERMPKARRWRALCSKEAEREDAQLVPRAAQPSGQQRAWPGPHNMFTMAKSLFLSTMGPRHPPAMGAQPATLGAQGREGSRDAPSDALQDAQRPCPVPAGTP